MVMVDLKVGRMMGKWQNVIQYLKHPLFQFKIKLYFYSLCGVVGD